MQTVRILTGSLAAVVGAATLVQSAKTSGKSDVSSAQDAPLTIRVASMTLPNDASITLDGKTYRCHQREGCKAIFPGGGYAIFLPKEQAAR